MRSLRIPDGCRGSSQVHALCPVDNTDSFSQQTSSAKGERLTPEDSVPSPRSLLTLVLCHVLILFGVLRQSQVGVRMILIFRSFELDRGVNQFTARKYACCVSLFLFPPSNLRFLSLFTHCVLPLNCFFGVLVSSVFFRRICVLLYICVLLCLLLSESLHTLSQ